MRSRQMYEAGSRVVLFIGQVIILVFCISYIQLIYNNNILPDKEVNDNYSVANCTIVDKKLETKGRVLHTYRADFLVSYAANGVQYNRWVSANGLDLAFSSDRVTQESELSQFNKGDDYSCWYNPADPQIAVLVLRHNWLSTFPLVVPSVIALIVSYYMMRTVAEILAIMAVKTRDKARERKEKKKKK